MIYIISNDPKFEFFDNHADIDDLDNYFLLHKEVAVDTETSGWSFTTAHLYTIQVGDENRQFVVDIPSLTETEKSRLIKFLEEKIMILHNSLFDIPFLYDFGCRGINVYDTYLGEYVLTMGHLNPGRGLDDLCSKYLGVTLDKTQRKVIQNHGVSTHEDIVYCAEDVKYLLKIKDLQYDKIFNEEKIEQAIKLENEFVKVLAYIEYCGMYLNPEKWMDRVRLAEYLEYGALLGLRKAAEEYNIDASINWNSTKQVIESFKSLDIDLFNKAEKKDSLSAPFLQKKKHPLIPIYLYYKEKQKVVSTYGRNWFDYIQDDGRIHTKYKAMVDTGRTSCGGVQKGPFPNMQNLPTDSDTRECFEAKGNNMLVIGDYSSQESIIMAEFSKEPALIEFFKNGGGDMHAHIAKQIFKDKLAKLSLKEVKEKHPDLRAKAKAAGFAIQYGGSGYTIADNMNIPHAEGEIIYNQYFKAFPKLKDYFEKIFNTSLNDGYIKINSVTNRKRKVDNIDMIKSVKENKPFWDKYYNEKDSGGKTTWFEKAKEKVRYYNTLKSSIYRLCLNTPIQGTAADMSKLAGILVFRWIMENNKFGIIKIVNFVHDEYVLESPQKSVDKVADMLKENMEKASKFFVRELSITVNPVISKVWQK